MAFLCAPGIAQLQHDSAFNRIAALGDLDGDGKADIVWRNTSTGENYVYFMNGLTITSQGYLPTVTTDWTIAGLGDLDGDGKVDIVWRNTSSGNNYAYLMNGLAITSQGYFAAQPPAWAVAAVADYDGDGKADIVWRNSVTGEDMIVFMDGLTPKAGSGAIPTVPLDWQIVNGR